MGLMFSSNASTEEIIRSTKERLSRAVSPALSHAKHMAQDGLNALHIIEKHPLLSRYASSLGVTPRALVGGILAIGTFLVTRHAHRAVNVYLVTRPVLATIQFLISQDGGVSESLQPQSGRRLLQIWLLYALLSQGVSEKSSLIVMTLKMVFMHKALRVGATKEKPHSASLLYEQVIRPCLIMLARYSPDLVINTLGLQIPPSLMALSLKQTLPRPVWKLLTFLQHEKHQSSGKSPLGENGIPHVQEKVASWISDTQDYHQNPEFTESTKFTGSDDQVSRDHHFNDAEGEAGGDDEELLLKTKKIFNPTAQDKMASPRKPAISTKK
jgi:hypothetical protein